MLYLTHSSLNSLFQFDIKDINHSGAVVDHQKLDWINKHHILKRAETTEGLHSLVQILKPFVTKSYQHLEGTVESYRLQDKYLARVIDTIKVSEKSDLLLFNSKY